MEKQTWVQSLSQEDPLEKEMATHSSTLASEIPQAEKPGGLQSMWLKRVGGDWVIDTGPPPELQFSSVQSLSCVQIFATPGTAARQASLSITNSQSLLKLMSIESVMPSIISSSVDPFSSCPQSLPTSVSFPMSQLFAWGGQSIGVSASTSVLPMNTQDWSPIGWTGWISLQSKGLSRVFSNTTVQKHQFFGAQLSSQSNSHIHTWPLGKP